MSEIKRNKCCESIEKQQDIVFNTSALFTNTDADFFFSLNSKGLIFLRVFKDSIPLC